MPTLNHDAPPYGLSAGRGFHVFKLAVYGLLLFDTGLLYVHGSWREVLEQSGWLMILAAFEAESRGLGALGAGRMARPLIGLELAGYSVAVFCWAAYAQAGEWLNLANATLWLLVAAAIARDLHRPGRRAAPGWWPRNMVKAGLYAGIIGIALSWGLAGDWLDAWDAVLWLLCFFVIELKLLDVLHARFRRRAGSSGG